MGKLLDQALSSKKVPADYVDLVDQLVHGLQFIWNAALGAAPVLAKLSVSAGVIRCVL